MEAIFDRGNTNITINHTATYGKILEDGQTYSDDFVRNVLRLGEAETLQVPKSADIFEKFLCKKLKDSFQRYTYLRLIGVEDYQAIFSTEIDPEVFMVIVDTVSEQVLCNENFNNPDEQDFVLSLLSCIANQTPGFSDFVNDFFGKEEKAKIKAIIEKLGMVDQAALSDLKTHFQSIL